MPAQQSGQAGAQPSAGPNQPARMRPRRTPAPPMWSDTEISDVDEDDTGSNAHSTQGRRQLFATMQIGMFNMLHEITQSDRDGTPLPEYVRAASAEERAQDACPEMDGLMVDEGLDGIRVTLGGCGFVVRGMGLENILAVPGVRPFLDLYPRIMLRYVAPELEQRGVILRRASILLLIWTIARWLEDVCDEFGRQGQ